MDDGVDLPLLGFLGLGVRPALLLFPLSISFLPFMGLADAALVTLPLLLPRLRSDGAFFLAGGGGAMSEESEPSSSESSRLCFFTRFEGAEDSCLRFLECLFLLLLLYRFLAGGGADSTGDDAFFSAGVLRRL